MYNSGRTAARRKKRREEGRKLEKKYEKIFGVEIVGICGVAAASGLMIGEMF